MPVEPFVSKIYQGKRCKSFDSTQLPWISRYTNHSEFVKTLVKTVCRIHYIRLWYKFDESVPIRCCSVNIWWKRRARGNRIAMKLRSLLQRGWLQIDTTCVAFSLLGLWSKMMPTYSLRLSLESSEHLSNNCKCFLNMTEQLLLPQMFPSFYYWLFSGVSIWNFPMLRTWLFFFQVNDFRTVSP